MQSEAANLAGWAVGLVVAPSPAHPGGVCRRTTLPCPSCHGVAPLVQRYGTTMVHCPRCRFGWGLQHDPVRCWERIRL